MGRFNNDYGVVPLAVFEITHTTYNSIETILVGLNDISLNYVQLTPFLTETFLNTNDITVRKITINHPDSHEELLNKAISSELSMGVYYVKYIEPSNRNINNHAFYNFIYEYKVPIRHLWGNYYNIKDIITKRCPLIDYILLPDGETTDSLLTLVRLMFSNTVRISKEGITAL